MLCLFALGPLVSLFLSNFSSFHTFSLDRYSDMLHATTYILPALLLAVLTNLPKFFETELVWIEDLDHQVLIHLFLLVLLLIEPSSSFYLILLFLPIFLLLLLVGMKKVAGQGAPVLLAQRGKLE